MFLLLTAVPAVVRGENLPLIVTADRMTSDGEGVRVTATGDVHVVRNGLTLLADTVSYDRLLESVVAQGQVSVERQGDLLRGDRAEINFGAQRGTISHALLTIKQSGARVTGDEIEKKGDKEYGVSKGSLTMCDADPPAWRFSAKDIDISEKYASGKHVILSVADVPVFYFPYLLVPVSRERQSGLLIPRVGVSSKKGFFLEIPYYLNINPSQEATAYLDIQSKRGAGTGVDYRYLRPNGGSGSASGYMIYDQSQDRFRGMIQEKHQEYFSPTLSFKTSVELATDQDFLRDFSASSGDYNRQYLETNAFFTKNGEYWSLTPQVKYVYKLDTANNSDTLQQLPTISFTGIKRPVADPLFFSVDADLTDFYREKGLQGQRFRFAPLLTVYASPASWLDVSVWGGYGASLYNAYGGPDQNGLLFGSVTSGVTASNTLTRVYDANLLGVQRIRHVLIPEVTYNFVDSFDTTPPPYFDTNDKLANLSMLTWSVTNYVTGRYRNNDGVSEYRELLYLKLSQGYDFQRTGRDLLTNGGQSRPLTDLRMETRITPLKSFSMLTDSRFNVYDARFSSIDVVGEYRDVKTWMASLGYHYATSSWDYLEGRFAVPLGHQFTLNYHGRYVIPGSIFLENMVALEYHHQCWGIAFSYQHRNDTTEFMVNMSLNGIGSIGKMNLY